MFRPKETPYFSRDTVPLNNFCLVQRAPFTWKFTIYFTFFPVKIVYTNWYEIYINCRKVSWAEGQSYLFTDCIRHMLHGEAILCFKQIHLIDNKWLIIFCLAPTRNDSSRYQSWKRFLPLRISGCFFLLNNIFIFLNEPNYKGLIYLLGFFC